MWRMYHRGGLALDRCLTWVLQGAQLWWKDVLAVTGGNSGNCNKSLSDKLTGQTLRVFGWISSLGLCKLWGMRALCTVATPWMDVDKAGTVK
jgi:hypothetical protein